MEIDSNEGLETNEDVNGSFDEEFQDAELQQEAGITPDSWLYFVEDAVLSKFRDEIENREKKVAEVKQMI